jgi:hypothetical protein
MAKATTSLRDRILNTSSIDSTATIQDSQFFKDKDMVPTAVPMINVALSGSFDGGLTPGVTMIAGPSKHFKTGFALLIANAYLTKYPDGVVLLYDSEFGSPRAYFQAYDIPLDSVVHTPITDVEQLKHDIMLQLAEIKRGDHILIIIDSIGNMASKKEVDDALEGKSVADFTRAKALKSLFRMITPHLTIKDIPLIAINHTYKTMEMYSRDVVSGGTGSYYNSDNIWIVGRQQDKDKDKELRGFNFIINIEKSRSVKEKSKIPISVSFENGIAKYSGLFDLAEEAGLITSETKGKYQVGKWNEDEKGFSRTEVESMTTVWDSLLQDDYFKEFVEKKYKLSMASIVQSDE